MIKYDIYHHHEDHEVGLTLRYENDIISLNLDELRLHRHALDHYIIALEALEANLPRMDGQPCCIHYDADGTEVCRAYSSRPTDESES